MKKSSLALEIDTFEPNVETKHRMTNLSPAGMSINIPNSPTSKLFNEHNFDEMCDDFRVQNLTYEIENLNNDVKRECSIYYNSEKVGNGSSAEIFTISENPNLYVKISDLPFDSYLLSKSNVQGITCETIGDKLNVSINEIENATKFEKLSYAFPRNIMKIHSAERCVKNYGDIDFFANKFLIEKVNGLTLDEAIVTMTESELFCCIIQLIYILSYANMQGYFHNDITCNNIMIYYDEANTLMLNKLFLLEHNIICQLRTTKLPIVKLIDFSYSEHIDYKLLQSMNSKVVIGEPQQVLKIIKNKLIYIRSNLQNSNIFKNILTLFDMLNKENPLLGYKYIELDAQLSSMGFRTLTASEIVEMSITKEFAETTLLKCFKEIKNIFDNNKQHGIYFEIISAHLDVSPQLAAKQKLLKKSQIYQKKSVENYTLAELQKKYIEYAKLNDALLQNYYA